MATIDWYFDVISPFAYLQCERLDELGAAHDVRPTPVLFAGLLNHWGHKGPAEIPAKRTFTYRYVTWYARRLGRTLRVPRAHPFNPLPLLRLAVAAGSTAAAARAVCRYVWVDGEIPDDGPAFQRLCESLGVAAPATALAAPAVKAAVRDNTERACAAGVFGVPTAMVDDRLFWGVDATDMLLDYLAAPDTFFDAELERAADVPPAATRPQSR